MHTSRTPYNKIVQSLSSTNLQLTSEVARENSRIAVLEEAIAHSSVSDDESLKLITTLMNELKSHDAYSRKCFGQVQDVEHKYQIQNVEYDRVASENKHLKSLVNSFAKNLTDSVKSLQSEQENTQKLQGEVENVHGRENVLISENAQLNERLKVLINSTVVLQEIASSFKRNISIYAQKYESVSSELRSLKREVLLSDIDSCKTHLHETTAHLELTKQTLHDTQYAKGEMSAKYEALNSQFEAKENELSLVKENFDKFRTTLLKKIQTLNGEKSKLLEQLASAQASVESACQSEKAEIEKAKDELHQCETIRKTLVAEKKLLETAARGASVDAAMADEGSAEIVS